MNDDRKSSAHSKPAPQPFKGSEEIIKNLSTLPEGSGDRGELLSQVAPEELTQQPTSQPQSQPAQNEEGSHESK